MQKKLIALAVAAALTAPAAAMAADVTVYGKAFLTMDQTSVNTVNTPNKTQINSNASRLGFKVSEDLGDGLKALVQYELEMDATGQLTTTTGTGLGKSRNSGAGFEGDFGKVMVGIWDTPYKVVHNKIELFDNTTHFSAQNVVGHSQGKNFQTRKASMIQYWSPKFSGFQVAAMYSPDPAPTATVGATAGLNKSSMSFSGTYDVDALYVSLGYETRNDVAFAGKTDSATRLAAKYNLGDFWLGGMVESIKTNTSAIASVTGNNAEFVGQFNFGANSVALSLAKQGSTSVAPALSNAINQTTLKLNHSFSKSTDLFAAYTSNKADNAAVTGITTTYVGFGLIKSF